MFGYGLCSAETDDLAFLALCGGWRITILANTTATIYVPVAEGSRVSEGAISAANAPGVRFLRREAAAEVYEVAAREYHFIAG